MSLKVAVFSFLACFFMSLAPSWALDVKSVRFGSHGEKERAVIELTSATKFRTFVMQNPDRIVVDMGEFGWKAGNINRPQGSLVKDVRYGALGAGKGRLVIETVQPVLIKSAFPIEKAKGQPDKLVIDFSANANPDVAKEAASQVLGTMPTEMAMAPAVQLPPKKGKGRSGPSQEAYKPQKQKLIIIDPGHGGQDPGAIGANGMYEKSIVLAVGLELRRQLESAGYKVEMTRSTDVFIPLHQRVVFARKKGGDLFISLHADSVSRSNVTGASVYTLSDKASDVETEKLAERENKSDLIAGIDLSHQEDDVADILIDLAARDTMNQSRFMAKTVIRTFDQSGVNILDEKFRSAGFAVLKAMDIPSILVEMGYLTNREEVERLSSSSYRLRVAQALRESVDKYFQKNSH